MTTMLEPALAAPVTVLRAMPPSRVKPGADGGEGGGGEGGEGGEGGGSGGGGGGGMFVNTPIFCVEPTKLPTANQEYPEPRSVAALSLVALLVLASELHKTSGLPATCQAAPSKTLTRAYATALQEGDGEE